MPNLNPVSLIGAKAPGHPPGKAAHLSQREKAAIVVRFLLSEGAEVTLKHPTFNLRHIWQP